MRFLISILFLFLVVTRVDASGTKGSLSLLQEENAGKLVPFIPRYNDIIDDVNHDVNDVFVLDLDRITRLRRDYDMDWYVEYCGSPELNISADIAATIEEERCISKLNNLSESELKSLIIYKTNFTDPETVSPQITEKTYEILRDIKDKGVNSKYYAFEDFIYSPDVLLGIIYMKGDSTSDSFYEKIYYEEGRLERLKEEYDFSVLDKRCGDTDKSINFHFCEDDLSSKRIIDQCIYDNYQKACFNGGYVDNESFYQSLVCSCSPEVNNVLMDLSLEEIKSLLVVYANDNSDDYRISYLVYKLSSEEILDSEKYEKILSFVRSKDILPGFVKVISIKQSYINRNFVRVRRLIAILNREQDAPK